MESVERLVWLGVAVAAAALFAYLVAPLLQTILGGRSRAPELIGCTNTTMFIYVEPGYTVCWGGSCHTANSSVATAPADAVVTVEWPGGVSTFTCNR